jgi:hypothetical protein
MLCVRANCQDEAQRIQSSAFSILTLIILFLKLSRNSKIIFLIHCDTRGYKFFENYPARFEKKRLIIFIFICSYELSSVLETGVSHSSLRLLVSGSYSQNQLSSHVMTRLRKCGSVSSRSSISADTSFRPDF